MVWTILEMIQQGRGKRHRKEPLSMVIAVPEAQLSSPAHLELFPADAADADLRTIGHL